MKKFVYCPVSALWFDYLLQIDIEDDLFKSIFSNQKPDVEYLYCNQDCEDPENITLFKYPKNYESKKEA